MKKILFIICFNVANSYGQIGINNKTPKATVDVVAVTDTNSVVDGIIPPKLSGDELYVNRNNYTINQKGIIVYVTAAANTLQGPTIHVTNKGYYYYDGTKWIRFGNYIDVNTPKTNNSLYTEDGKIIENRTLSMSNYDMTFDFIPSTSKISFSIDDNTFAVNVKDNFVGMGTSSPDARLHINGIVNNVEPLLKIDKLATTNSTQSYIQRNNTYDLKLNSEGNTLKTNLPISGETTSNKPYTIDEAFEISTTPIQLPNLNYGTALVFNFIVNFKDDNGSLGILYSKVNFSMINKFRLNSYTNTINNVTVTGDGTNVLTYDIVSPTNTALNTKLIIQYVGDTATGNIEIYKQGGNKNLNIHFWNSIKIR